MITIKIPFRETLNIAYIVCDFNGTLAIDGILLPGASEALNNIKDAQIHVITGDTFGTVKKQLANTNCILKIAPQEGQAKWKQEYIKSLNPLHTACIGNGRNDMLMLKDSALGIVLIQREGASVQTFINADIVCSSIIHALEYFSNPVRLMATLRT